MGLISICNGSYRAPATSPNDASAFTIRIRFTIGSKGTVAARSLILDTRRRDCRNRRPGWTRTFWPTGIASPAPENSPKRPNKRTKLDKALQFQSFSNWRSVLGAPKGPFRPKRPRRIVQETRSRRLPGTETLEIGEYNGEERHGGPRRQIDPRRKVRRSSRELA
jgi:hypothetical protein